ncbi:hypothetical protein, partial [Kitasatospora sp. SolWspMP-SS2h]|uniref:hypothetical protein n=1 Tax=Kitasatospora sp. SolWspMP-SS2h TaxID=1305729 RepID=UPI0011B9447E
MSGDAQRVFSPKATAWPKAASGRAALPGSGGKAEADGTPVWVESAKGSSASAVDVKVLDHAKSAQLGVSGVVFTVDGGDVRGKARVGVDYSSFAEALGGNYASRLHLVSLPACALTTPEVAACRVQTPLVTDRDAVGKNISAEVDLS